MFVFSIFSLVKKREKRDKDGHIISHTLNLEAAPLQKSSAFKLDLEDPKYYKNELGYSPRKEWDEPLPSSQQGQVATISQERVKLALQVHHTQVKFLHSLGIDACREYQQTNVQYVLEAVTSKDLSCKLCDKVCASAVSLRSHIRTTHMDTTPFQCGKCKKYFGDNSTYNAHLKVHAAKAARFPCDQCDRDYPDQGRLNSHKKVHDISTHVQCRFCGKDISQKKNLATHEKTCPQQPGGKDAAVKDVLCPHCDKTFYHQKDLCYHLNNSHTSRAKQK